jgi:plastocyanin
MRRIRALLLMTAAALMTWSGPTSAAPSDTQVVSGPTAKYYGYLTPVVMVSRGGAITYTNLDLERHNVV